MVHYAIEILTMDNIGEAVAKENVGIAQVMLQTAKGAIYTLTDGEAAEANDKVDYTTVRLIFETANRVWVEDVEVTELNGGLYVSQSEVERVMT